MFTGRSSALVQIHDKYNLSGGFYNKCSFLGFEFTVLINFKITPVHSCEIWP